MQWHGQPGGTIFRLIGHFIRRLLQTEQRQRGILAFGILPCMFKTSCRQPISVDKCLFCLTQIAIADPLADKLTMLAVTLVLASQALIPLWLAAAIVVVNGFFPAVWILLTSLKTETELIRSPITWLPEAATLDYVPNPRTGALYLVRFAAPEFTSLCPVTGQPDFAHLVIDYAPGDRIVESKSLKLFLGSFRNHCGFHEDVTVGIGQRLDRR